MRRALGLVLISTLAVVAASAVRAQEEIRGRAKVLASDTLEVSGKRYRLFGIIGPAKDQKCRIGALPWLCGNAAYNHLVEQVDGKLVTCVDKGISADNKPVALCKAEGRDLGYLQVRNGWANADRKSDAGYENAELAARGTKIGFWKGTTQ